MQSKANGFLMDVIAPDGAPRVQVRLRSGETVLDTDKLSLQGMENLSEALKSASKMAARELERYWHRQQAQVRTLRAERGAQGQGSQNLDDEPLKALRRSPVYTDVQFSKSRTKSEDIGTLLT